ncbi:hypothetical protein ACWDUL_20895 [Nocardia niigatensis]
MGLCRYRGVLTASTGLGAELANYIAITCSPGDFTVPDACDRLDVHLERDSGDGAVFLGDTLDRLRMAGLTDDSIPDFNGVVTADEDGKRSFLVVVGSEVLPAKFLTDPRVAGGATAEEFAAVTASGLAPYRLPEVIATGPFPTRRSLLTAFDRFLLECRARKLGNGTDRSGTEPLSVPSNTEVAIVWTARLAVALAEQSVAEWVDAGMVVWGIDPGLAARMEVLTAARLAGHPVVASEIADSAGLFAEWVSALPRHQLDNEGSAVLAALPAAAKLGVSPPRGEADRSPGHVEGAAPDAGFAL